MFKRFKQSLLKDSFFGDLVQLCSLLVSLGMSLKWFVFSVVLASASAYLQLLVMSLLFPLLNSVVRQNYEAARGVSVIAKITRQFPDYFHSNASLFGLMVFTLYVANLGKGLFSYGASLLMSSQSRATVVRLREVIFQRCLIFGKQFFDAYPPGKLYSILEKSAQNLEQKLSSLTSLLIQLSNLLIAVGIMLWVSWQLTALVVLVFFFTSLFTQTISSKLRQASRSHSGSLMNLNLKVSDVFSSIVLVKGFAREEHESKYFSEANQKEAELSFKKNRLIRLLEPANELSYTTAQVIIAVGLSWVGRGNGLDASQIIIYFYLVMRAAPSFYSINELRLLFAKKRGDKEQFDWIMSDEDKFIVPSGKTLFRTLEQKISIQNLNFSYLSDKPVLKGINLEIEQGKVTSLVGPSGVGKSTLVHLLLRFYDCPENTIFIDGSDIRTFEISSLKNQFSFVSQDTVILNDTLRANLSYGLRDEASDAELKEILEMACLYDFVKSLPNGLDTLLGHRGLRLSGGERQRVAIARALIKKAQILIFDEPTSALDNVTENLIIKAIQNTIRGKTVIAIAHRISTIVNSHKIVLLENGLVEEQGSLDELLQKNGRFCNYWKPYASQAS